MEPVRNPIGANMSVRTRLALEVGAFDTAVGRVGTRPVGCEETELSIRLTSKRPGSAIFYVPAAAVDHHVSRDRMRVSYFLRRCWHEGISKATVVRLAGASSGLERERRHVAIVIPMSLLQDLRGFLTGDAGGLMRLTATLAGLSSAGAGYLIGCIRLAYSRPKTPTV